MFMAIHLCVSNDLPKDEFYTQDTFRIDVDGDDIVFILNLHIPERLEDDKKPISQSQRSTIDGFYYDHEIAPENCGWQQASAMLNVRLLSYAVSETLENGFLAANRIFIAPLIAAYISQNPYLCAVSRGWSLGNWMGSEQGSKQPKNKSELIPLISSPFYKELFDFSQAASTDIARFFERITPEALSTS